jgi:isopenicillin N synthase-like dioxygenase
MAEKLYNLKEDYVETVEYPLEIRESVDSAAALWEQFCKLPDEVKQAFGAQDAQWTVGYEAKDGSGTKGDRKENFDFSVSGLEHLREVAAGTGNPTAVAFIDTLASLSEKMVPMIESFGGQVEREYDVPGFADIAQRSASTAFFRFLHYPASGIVGEEIAAAHVDHSGFTFHLSESTDGCYRLTAEGEWVPIPVDEGQAVVFASMQTQLVSKGELKAMWHEVRSNEESAQIGRYAIVCFVALDGQPSYDRKTYGRLQEWEAGSTYQYGMDGEPGKTSEDFAKFFTAKK